MSDSIEGARVILRTKGGEVLLDKRLKPGETFTVTLTEGAHLKAYRDKQ